MAPYLMRFLLAYGTVLFPLVLCWTLLLGVVFFRAQRLAGFDHRAWKTRLCLLACSLVLAVPVLVSLLVFVPTDVKASSCTTSRPYENVLGRMDHIRVRALERFYHDLIDCGPTRNPLRPRERVTMERALVVWVGALAVLIYITWHRPRDRSSDAGSRVSRELTRTESMALVAVLAALAGVTMFVAYKDGIGYANDLRRGSTFGEGFSVFSIRGSPVCVASQDSKFDLDEPVMLLGETSSRVIVFQFGKEDRLLGNTLKLPAGGVLVRHLQGGLTGDRFAEAQEECRNFVAELLAADEDADRPAPVPATSSTRVMHRRVAGQGSGEGGGSPPS
jgi:hypothetical protein